MYSTCLFCHAPLGANQVIEHLPVGRRLAFDNAQGRLWVVCRACRRWSLTPIEERWEAIEECERQFRTARVRASTDEIGLARLPEGLELVRIGKPPQAELATWRYVDAFRRRRNQAIAAGAASVVVLAGLVAGGFALVGTGALTSVMFNAFNLRRNERVVHRIQGPFNTRITVRARQAGSVRWIPTGSGGPLTVGLPDRVAGPSLQGEAAERALRPILAHLNRYAGRPVVEEAVGRLNRWGDDVMSGFGRMPIPFRRVAESDRLAIEMILAEREEQRLLAGELAGLTLAWREAEEIAAIADNLLLPESVTNWLRRQKRNDS